MITINKKGGEKMKRGFTLIELVMVVVILGILAATALPRFIDLSAKAKESAAKGTLGGIRAAVAIQYASNATYGNAAWPSAIDANLFADNQVPADPYSAGSNANSVVYQSTAPTGVGSGWVYDSLTGRVWINNSNYSLY
jgi:prepilin-type N-terminal cleavage/methylation domain-containing protein